MAIFPLTNKIKYKHADRIECQPYIRGFVRLPNVSSQLYTFSCLYLLEKKCNRLNNCRLVQNDLSFRVLSRRSTDHHVARTRPQPCSISLTTLTDLHFHLLAPKEYLNLQLISSRMFRLHFVINYGKISEHLWTPHRLNKYSWRKNACGLLRPQYVCYGKPLKKHGEASSH